jgi:predicted transcriptional regulator of viral defense system
MRAVTSGILSLTEPPWQRRMNVNVKAKVREDISSRSGGTHTLLEQIQAEYAEMPGLSVTLPQAQRLWAVDQTTCEEVFSRLISRGVLKRTSKGRFIRA